MNAKRITLIGLVAFISLIPVFALRGRSKQASERADLSVQTKQLPPDGGKIPVEIQRAKIHLSQPHEIEDFSCVVKNNTNKTITALAVEWTFTADINGKKSTSAEFSEMDAIYHPDIQDHRKLRALVPGNEITMESSGSTSVNPPARIVQADVALVYIHEFRQKMGRVALPRGASPALCWMYDKNK